MADRPALWRRVYAALGARGMLPADLRETASRGHLTRLLLGRRGAEAYREPEGARAELERALNLPAGALADDARWALTVEAEGAESVVVEL